MRKIGRICKADFDSIPIDKFWNIGREAESKMHRIHSYPAKFPAFITAKALDYANKRGLNVTKISDVFCGCGTVALEAKRNGINFWGCDINPVATLIARAKSLSYKERRLQDYLTAIIAAYRRASERLPFYGAARERLSYWYSKKQMRNLAKLKAAILSCIPKNSHYRDFFLCAFSNILKATSRWLTKSIKPQVDPTKEPIGVLAAFKDQCLFMMEAAKESQIDAYSSQTEIVTGNFLGLSVPSATVDMIITSPPYVTSYEYADLHQLSSLWLNFADDYRELREGSIGSLHHCYNFNRELKRLNSTGSEIVFRLLDQFKAKARSVAKYFLDMQQAAARCHNLLTENGLALFVIGNTEYKGVRIDNAKHLAESLRNSGFRSVHATKRKITNKILTPYRDEKGRFSDDESNRKVYSEEFILIGTK